MSAREKARRLVTLATDKRTPSNERRVAAMSACKLIRKYKLLESPIDDIASHPLAQAGKTIFDAFNDPNVKAAGSVISDLYKRARAAR